MWLRPSAPASAPPAPAPGPAPGSGDHGMPPPPSAGADGDAADASDAAVAPPPQTPAGTAAAALATTYQVSPPSLLPCPAPPSGPTPPPSMTPSQPDAHGVGPEYLQWISEQPPHLQRAMMVLGRMAQETNQDPLLAARLVLDTSNRPGTVEYNWDVLASDFARLFSLYEYARWHVDQRGVVACSRAARAAATVTLNQTCTFLAVRVEGTHSVCPYTTE